MGGLFADVVWAHYVTQWTTADPGSAAFIPRGYLMSVIATQSVCARAEDSWLDCCAGTFKHAHGDYSTAIRALAALSAVTCVLTASFPEPDRGKHADSSKAHNVAV